MKKHTMKPWDYTIETLCITGAVLYLILQLYYGSLYKIGVPTILVHLITMVLIFAGLTILQIFPELMNVGCKEAVEGKVRLYAVRMLRMVKLVLVLGMLVPSICDVRGTLLNAAYSLIIVVFLLLIGGYYLYRIWKYNRSQGPKK